MIQLYKDPRKLQKMTRDNCEKAYRGSRAFLTNLYKVEDLREDYLQRKIR